MLSLILENRHLVRELVLRDVRGRYVGSLLGMVWTIFNPLLLLALYTFLVAGVFRMRWGNSDSTLSLALSIFSGLLPWIALQESVNRSAVSYIENRNLIKKLRFPLEVLPIKIVLSALFHQGVGTLLFVAVLAALGELYYRYVLLIPFLLALQCFLAYGTGLAVAALNVFFRDIAQALGVLFLGLFWMTPIVYPRHADMGLISQVLGLNPLTHLIEAYRWVLLGARAPSPGGIFYLVCFCGFCLLLGRSILNRTRHDLVDLI